MTKLCLLSLLELSCLFSSAQGNVGIGTNQPLERLHLNGSLLVQQPYTATNSLPTPAQTKTMVAGTTISFSQTDSTGRLYDPGGPAGLYPNNALATAKVFSNGTNGYEVSLDDVQIGPGDSLVVRDEADNALLAVGNSYTTPGKYIFHAQKLSIVFKANNDGLNGKGSSKTQSPI